VRQVERYRKTRHAVGCKPFFCKPDVGTEIERSGFELTVELFNALL